ncbi:MAG: S8 family peptidase [Burkholderiales bacterium]|nr:S8 family peptidase [Burkholderiales bacterium]
MPWSACRRIQLVVCAALALAYALPAAAEDVAKLRVMLHPYAAAPGEFPEQARAQLEALAGTTLTLVGTTRTGALELALPAPLPEEDAKLLVRQLRVDRSVLWAEVVPGAGIERKSTVIDPYSDGSGRRLMVRLKNGVTPDWTPLLGRLGARIGMPLKLERQIGSISVLSVSFDQSASTLAQFAQLLQEDPEVQYADPVKRAYPKAAPNDPLYPRQWPLHGAQGGINLETAWTLQPNATGITVAVIDTGILPHPDLVDRVLPGYDFISDPGRARDGNERDPDPRDEGDWSDGNCGAKYDSFFHGLFVAGLIGANTNNDIGIAGVADGVRILPVRVLGACGGTFEDVLEGMLWASGVPIAGVPKNTTPARVLNLSLGGFGACDQALQEAIDDALAMGSVVVVSAGNETRNVSDFTPANCSGVIAVGAHDAQGGLTSYSNYGRRIDLTAPGGTLPLTDLIVSLSNNGTTVPQDPDYGYAAGTSFSAPLVSGTAALMLARDPLLTSGRVFDIITGTTRNFPVGSKCTVPNLCGSGMLDSGAAIGSTIPGGSPPPYAYRVVEYYRADIDHYFITADPAEAHFIDTFLRGIFERTGLYFYAYLNPDVAPPGAQSVCRFYASSAVQINSHYYSADLDECLAVLFNWAGIWELETATAFYVQVPDSHGNCPPKTLPVYRFFNNRRDANHRYTVDLSVRREMLNRAWTPEGAGPTSIAFCSAV